MNRAVEAYNNYELVTAYLGQDHFITIGFRKMSDAATAYAMDRCDG